jgi:uroporphyrinogen-III synthase
VSKIMAHLDAWPSALPAAAVGGGTRRELERRGVTSVIAPQAGADSEALLALGEMQQVGGKRVVIFRGEGGRELLGDTLRSRGAEVVYAAGYRRTRPKGARQWEEGEIDAVTVSSSQGLANLFEVLDAAFLRARPLFVPHPRVAGNARGRAVREVVVAGPSDEQVLEALVAYFQSHG